MAADCHKSALPSMNQSRKDMSAGNFQQSKKGQPWTETEHAAFVEGLKKLGKGNWRGISRVFVTSRTPTQVASHAQKHFMRIQGVTKRKSRFSSTESLEDFAGKSSSSAMCSPATSESFDQPPGNAAALLRTEAHSSQAAGRHRSAAAPALATSYYPQPIPHSLMYPYMGAGALDGSTASSWSAFSAALDALPAATAILYAQAAASMAVQCTAQYAKAAAAFPCGSFVVPPVKEQQHQQQQQAFAAAAAPTTTAAHINLFTCPMPSPASGLPKPAAHRPRGGDIGWGHFLAELIRSSDAEDRVRASGAAPATPCGRNPLPTPNSNSVLQSSTHSAFRSLHTPVMA
ncbi:MAG: hypothetical protein WDW36_004680 [Sanguina aurantia]